jgi:hypothetical protein
MAEVTGQIGALLQEAAETHHRVYRIVDGADDDWASWYAWWLIKLSELPSLIGVTPVRSDLICLLVTLDHRYTDEQQTGPWSAFYAREIQAHYAR